MTTDRYTKVVLTVIALSLSVIAIQLSTKDAQAAQQSFRFTQNGFLMVTDCGYVNTREGVVERCTDGTRYKN